MTLFQTDIGWLSRSQLAISEIENRYWNVCPKRDWPWRCFLIIFCSSSRFPVSLRFSRSGWIKFNSEVFTFWITQSLGQRCWSLAFVEWSSRYRHYHRQLELLELLALEDPNLSVRRCLSISILRFKVPNDRVPKIVVIEFSLDVCCID